MTYFIITVYYDKEKDISDYLSYQEKVKTIVEHFGGRYILRSDKVIPLQEKWKPQCVICIEFENCDQLNACFSSVEYKSISYLREESVDAHAIIVEE